jgi:hypothetical protein
VVEDEFLVYVTVDEFIIEFCVECRINLLLQLRFGREDGGEWDDVVVLLISLFAETFWSEEFCVWKGFVPGTEEDMVLYYVFSTW